MELRAVSTVALARELARRLPRIAARRLRPRPAATTAGDTRRRGLRAFATFEREGLPPVELWDGYRDSIKASWRLYFWQTRTLLELGARVELPPAVRELADEVRAARTVPLPLGEIALALEREAGRFGGLLRRERRDDRVVLAVAQSPEEVAARAAAARATAAVLRDELRRHGVAPERAAVLEVGCGTAYVTFALAGLGAGRAVGVDRAVVESDEFAAVREHAADGRAAEVVRGDAHALPFDDGSFDAAFSISTLEHIDDPGRVFAELRRVLRAGGVMQHAVDPWFSPQGGHSVCTLDFPWGHARLTEDEFEAYVREHRPHEAEEALDFYRTGFQRPRLTLGELERAVVAAGFELLDQRESRDAYAGHLRFVDEHVVGDCTRANPAVGVRDLLTHGFAFTARRR